MRPRFCLSGHNLIFAKKNRTIAFTALASSANVGAKKGQESDCPLLKRGRGKGGGASGERRRERGRPLSLSPSALAPKWPQDPFWTSPPPLISQFSALSLWGGGKEGGGGTSSQKEAAQKLSTADASAVSVMNSFLCLSL